ncbi:MAG: FecR domain-containing protein [Planctomycetota bacterium]
MTELRRQQLLERFLDEMLTEDECGELIAWFDESPSALSEFADELRLVNALSAMHVAETSQISGAVLDSLRSVNPTVDISQRVRRQLESRPASTRATTTRVLSLGVRQALSAAAVFLVVVISMSMLRQRSSKDRSVAATVLRANSSSGFTRGDAFRIEDRIRIEQGSVVIGFLSGAKLAVEGPAEVIVAGNNRARMKHGLATIRVPGKVKGFTLDTPSEQVVDLGTSFGVAVANDGATSIAVFEGEIELRGQQHVAGPQRLVAGTSVRVEHSDEFPRDIPHSIHRYLGTWQVSFGVNDLVGDVRVATPTERQSPGQAMDRDSLLLFPERESVPLKRGYVVDATEPGNYRRPFRRRTKKIARDVRVDSFLLQFNPVRNQNVLADQTFRGELHFDRPIVAMILQKDLLDASDSLLALPDVDFSDIYRRGINATDVVTLSPDRSVMHVALQVANGVDQIRVLVESDTNTPGIRE